MPTNAELAKRLDSVESALSGKLNEVADIVLKSIKAKLETNPGLVVGSINKEIADFKESLSFFDETVESLKAEQVRLKAENKALAARNQTLEKRVAELEQYSRKNNVEVKGVPCTKGEDCIGIMEAIGRKIECPVTKGDLDVVHRVPSKSASKHIIARFTSRAKKAEFIAKARKARLQANDIGFHGTDNQAVYVNDHMTQGNKQLFAKALALKKEKKWQFLWTDDCVIKARQTTESRVLRIRDEADLEIFRRSTPTVPMQDDHVSS